MQPSDSTLHVSVVFEHDFLYSACFRASGATHGFRRNAYLVGTEIFRSKEEFEPTSLKYLHVVAKNSIEYYTDEIMKKIISIALKKGIKRGLLPFPKTSTKFLNTGFPCQAGE